MKSTIDHILKRASVLNGLFDFLNSIFNITFTKVNTPAWDDKAVVYELSDSYTNKTISRLYIDLEARDDKRGGAWMNNWHTHSIVDDKETLSYCLYCM